MCDKTTGRCPTGCDIGYSGTTCHEGNTRSHVHACDKINTSCYYTCIEPDMSEYLVSRYFTVKSKINLAVTISEFEYKDIVC